MDDVDQLRAFNRFYTRDLGLLGKSYLGSGLGVTEVRVLYELAQGGATEAREVARQLTLDEGYLSRVLRGFERRGWLARVPNEDDARRRALVLTAEGHAAFAPLEQKSRDEIATRLAGLGDAARASLRGAIGTLRSILGDPALDGQPIEFRGLQIGDPGWLIARHGELYALHEGFDASFEALVAEIVAGFVKRHDPLRERAFIAWQGARRVGSIFCVRQDDRTAKLRLFLLEPEMRGRGLGRKMLAECTSFAQAAGYTRMVLWTHKSHVAACALYEAAGFRMTGETPARSFGQDVIEQFWAIDF